MNNLKVIEHKQQRVLTTAQLAESYGTDNQNISKNYTRNIERYQEGIHFYKLESVEKRMFLNHVQIDDGLKNAQTVYLWTEKGALLHAKSLNTDEAWKVYEMLVDSYFRIKEQPKQPMLPQNYIEALEQLITTEKEKQELILLNEKNQKEIEHKENVIIALVDEISIAEKRQILNQVVKKSGPGYNDRWSVLYKHFNMKYHINLQSKFERYNESNKPKLKNKLDYVDKVLNKIPELYEIAAKLFENDVKKLVNELYLVN